MKFFLLLFLSMQFLFAVSNDNAYFKMKKEAYRYYDHGQEKKAIAHVQTFLKKYPENIRGKNLLAVFYYWNGNKKSAAKILKDIVAHADFPPAKRLLRNLESAQKSVLQKSSQKEVEKDLAYMLRQIQKNPTDIKDRKILANYYISINDKKHAVAMAKEVLSVNPDEIEMLALLKKNGVSVANNGKLHNRPSDARDKAMDILSSYFQQKKYHRFINLYKALVDRREYIPTYIHTDALYAAIALQKYPLAKKILLENNFHPTPHLHELKALIDQKLKVADLYL